jgi:uncharacterized protein (TIGR00369 family)
MQEDDLTIFWLKEEEDVRRTLLAAGVMPLEKLSHLSGLETLNAVFSGEFPPPPIGETLNFVPIRMEKGKAVFQGQPSRRHYNPLGSVHGGWFATLLDSAMGCAIHSELESGQGYTTVELKVNYIRPLTDRVGLVRAEGATIHVGRQTATAEARIFGPDGKLYAHASTTCLLFKHEGAKDGKV